MPNIGPLEILIILVIVLIIFGAKRIPEVGKSLGKGIRGFKSSLEGDKDEDDDEPEKDEPRQLPRSAQPTGKVADAEKAREDEPVREPR
jgi:sec-independent protein translocase protein TatA